MTKEEAIKILQNIVKHNEDEDAAIFMAIRALRDTSFLPSNLDEAANNYGIDIRLGYPRVMDETDRYIYNAFKAGAEWMAGQFQKIEGDLVDWYSTSDGKDYCCGVKTIDSFEVPEGFYIRKK